MRETIIVSILTLFGLAACNPDNKSFTENDKIEIISVLENLSLENLKNWEPPFYEDKLLQAFSQSEDFKVTIDGYHINDFKKWESIVYESMEYDRNNYKYYTHIIKNIQTTILNANSGIVTVNYIWDYITNDDLHYHNPATVTIVFRYENGEWKILNSHVSHGEKRLLNE